MSAFKFLLKVVCRLPRFGLCAAVLCLPEMLLAGEPPADEIVREILANVAKIRAADPEAVPMAFWDFDGTIIKGDVSEGLRENGEQRFAGLIERTIKAGLSPVYHGEEGWRRYFTKDYPRLCEIGLWLGWPFNAQIYEGVETEVLDRFCSAAFRETYAKWYFDSSVRILTALEKAGVRNYIVSASPEIFVRNAAASLHLPVSRFRGIRVAVSGGRMTTRLVYPVPYGEGKVENVRDLVMSVPHGVAVAGFGNSYSTDAPFLRYIATQPSLPGGARGFAMMINGGKTVPGYTEHFRCVTQDDLVKGIGCSCHCGQAD